jgi:hypothetical protein
VLAHRLRVVHPRITLETCEHYGILRISAVVRELLQKDFVPEYLQDADSHQVRSKCSCVVPVLLWISVV